MALVGDISGIHVLNVPGWPRKVVILIITKSFLVNPQ